MRALEEHRDDFDSIVVRGVSGLIVGAPVALLMDVPVVVVRKPGVSSHADDYISNFGNIGNRYVIVDDFVSMGNTRRSIIEAIELRSSGRILRPRYVNLFRYLWGTWNDPWIHLVR